MRITYVPGQNEMGDTSPIRLHTELPNPDTMLIARNELRETEERVKEATEELRRLLREDEKIYFRDDDDILLIFLRPTKFYPESALALMRRVAEFKEKNASVLKDLSPASERLTLTDNKVVNVLIDRDNFGRRILVANVGGLWDTQKVSGEQLFRVFYLIHLAAMREPETQIRGVVVILDFENLGMRQIKAMNLQFSVRLLSFIQKAMPLRMKEVHIVKQPFLFKMVWPIFKQFIEEKLSSRLYFHGSKMESLHKHIDPDYLPADYGGNKPKIDYSSADWYPVVSSLDEHVAEWQTFGKVKDGSN